jgi:hypothetical protein
MWVLQRIQGNNKMNQAVPPRGYYSSCKQAHLVTGCRLQLSTTTMGQWLMRCFKLHAARSLRTVVQQTKQGAWAHARTKTCKMMTEDGVTHSTHAAQHCSMLQAGCQLESYPLGSVCVHGDPPARCILQLQDRGASEG